MNLFHALVLGLVQGLTEFAPVSSSGHLVLVPWVLQWPAPSLAFDTMAHWGTLFAVLVYFWDDWKKIISGFFRSVFTRGPVSTAPGGRLADEGSRLAWWLIIGSIPAGIIGVLLESYFEALFSSPRAVGAFLIVTAAILILAEILARRTRDISAIGVREVLTIGVAQAIAIAPGISRSGATISAGLWCGLSRQAAARFSFLLGTPAIVGAGLLQLTDLFAEGGVAAQLPSMLGGFLAAAVSGYLAIRFLLSYLRRGRLFVFAIYCAIVGIAVVVATTIA